MKWQEDRMQTMAWNGTISNREAKEKVAKELGAKAKNGDVIGFGSGSTSLLAALEIARRVKEEGLKVTAIPTSQEMEVYCSLWGIPTTNLTQARPDWCFDGADEVDPHGWLVKGRGGAMFREKMVMAATTGERYILIDPSKRVSRICEKFHIPVECRPEAVNLVRDRLFDLGADDVVLRLAKSKDGPVITEFGNFILDVHFNEVDETLETRIKAITGVVESGLFIGFEPTVLCS